MTTNRPLSLFISSKLMELAEEHRGVQSALSAYQMHGWLFEQDAGARSEPIQSTYLKEVEACDIYIGLFWLGYGPYTIEEYEKARSLNKPCLVYEKYVDIDRRDPRLATFLQGIQQVTDPKGLTVFRFDTVEALIEQVQKDVMHLLVTQFRLSRQQPPLYPVLSEQEWKRDEVQGSQESRFLPGERIEARDIITTNVANVQYIHVTGQKDTPPFVNIDWNKRLAQAKDLRPESLKLGDITAAKFPYVITPIRDIYNEAIQALYEASNETKYAKNGILILGESNAGKTRLAFEAIKKALPTWPVLRWRPDYVIENAPPIEFLSGKHLAIFIDDLQDYTPSLISMRDLEGRNIAIDPRTTTVRSLLETIYQAAQCVVVATCRNEDRLRAQPLLDWLFVQLKHIVIPSFSKDPKNSEATQIITDFQKQGATHIEDWDGTLGSLVLGLSRKESQYLMLPACTQRILQAMKLLTLAGTQVHTERRLRAVCVNLFKDKEFLRNEQSWQESVNQLTQMQFVREELDEDTQEMTLVIRKDTYFEKVITDYPQPHRQHQVERDFVKLREVLVELKDEQPLLNLGMVQFFTNKKPEEALQSFDYAITLDPNNAFSWIQKGLVYFLFEGLVQLQETFCARWSTT